MPTTFILNEEKEGYKTGRYENNKKRLIQYKHNLINFLNYNLSSNFDLILSDNSENRIEDKTFLSILEKNKVACFFNSSNKYGGINKGAGVIENYLSRYDLLKDYEYILHFEPRQMLISSKFFKIFLEKPSNIFKYAERHWRNFYKVNNFYTGLFSIQSSIWFEFINDINLEKITNQNISIEYEIFNYLRTNNLDFKIVKKLGLCWHNSYLNKDIYY
mgnify:CR=1 FL=1|tara:strand:- start:10 stop:660 length:651 start_codon:yes stop_codon:yes gene_type:complete